MRLLLVTVCALLLLFPAAASSQEAALLAASMACGAAAQERDIPNKIAFAPVPSLRLPGHALVQSFGRLAEPSAPPAG